MDDKWIRLKGKCRCIQVNRKEPILGIRQEGGNRTQRKEKDDPFKGPDRKFESRESWAWREFSSCSVLSGYKWCAFITCQRELIFFVDVARLNLNLYHFSDDSVHASRLFGWEDSVNRYLATHVSTVQPWMIHWMVKTTVVSCGDDAPWPWFLWNDQAI